jgi:hypothetical protein
MSDWNTWRPAYDRITLSNDGDASEVAAAQLPRLMASFPNYERFWRYHIVPATNRPANIELRESADGRIQDIAIRTNAILNDLVNSLDNLANIQSGSFGNQFSTVVAFINNAGNAVQKFTDIQRQINAIASGLGTRPSLWSDADWNRTWGPQRQLAIGHRNWITHFSRPAIVTIAANSGNADSHFMLLPVHIRRDWDPTWRELMNDYEADATRWDSVEAVCEIVFGNSVRWLNDVYNEASDLLDQLLSLNDYRTLLGWDVPSRPRHPISSTGAFGPQGPAPPFT